MGFCKKCNTFNDVLLGKVISYSTCEKCGYIEISNGVGE